MRWYWWLACGVLVWLFGPILFVLPAWAWFLRHRRRQERELEQWEAEHRD